MQDIIKNHNIELERYKNKHAEIEAEKERLEARIERANKQLVRLEEKECKLHRPSRYDVIEALAKKLSEHYGLPYEIYGPFGLECETSIYLRKDMSKSICDQKTISIRLRPFGDRENDWITYDTGERTNRYAKGSMGELNGYNSVYAPLPTDFNEILKLMTYEEKDEVDLVAKEENNKELYVRLISADVCDFLEDLLEKHDLTVPSDDREGVEGEARIYGEIYFDLESNVADVLAEACTIVKENSDIRINADEIDELKPVSNKNELRVRAFAVKICELFEELLDEHDITIPSDDREGVEDEARIFGDVYYNLEDKITDVLAKLCEEVKASPDVVINVEDYNGFVKEPVQNQVGIDDVLADATARSALQKNTKNDIGIIKE